MGQWLPAGHQAGPIGVPVTMADVGRHAGVSTATVSRVLSGHPSVDTELAQRVKAAVQELDYRPNRLARNLRRQRSETIGVVSDIENPHFSEFRPEGRDLVFDFRLRIRKSTHNRASGGGRITGVRAPIQMDGLAQRRNLR